MEDDMKEDDVELDDMPFTQKKPKDKSEKTVKRDVNVKIESDHHHPHHKHKTHKRSSWPLIIGIVIVLLVVTAIVVYYLPKKFPSPKEANPNNPASGNLPIGNLDPSLAATVNGQPITKVYLNKSYNLYFFLSGIPDEQKAVLPQSKFLTEYLLLQEILIQEANHKGVKYSDADATKFVETVLASSPISATDLDAKLAEQGLTRADMVQFYKTFNTLAILINDSVFNAHELSIPERVRASHILVANESTAKDVLAQLKAGTSFEELAAKYNSDASANTGGDLGYFTKGQMVPEFEAAAFALPVGGLSDVVQTQFGFHIIKVTDKKPSEQKWLKDITDPAERQMAFANERQNVDNYIAGLRAKAKILVAPEYGNPSTPSIVPGSSSTPSDSNLAGTFQATGDPVCTDANGKPIVRLFTTSWCPHCQWIRETYESVVKDYESRGLIKAYHWELDTNTELLTGQKSTAVPAEELAVYRKYNPQGSIPTFVFGCQYVRIGNGYEAEQNLDKERAEFNAVITKLVAETSASAPTTAPTASPTIAPTASPTASPSPTQSGGVIIE
jgi:peptidyl-prolyl cis-trans isomerase C